MKNFETPEEYEKYMLERSLESLQNRDKEKKKCYFIGAMVVFAGLLFLVAVYFMHGMAIVDNIWRYMFCVISGLFIGTGLLVINIQHQSGFICNYIDLDAVRRRIKEIENMPVPEKTGKDEWM